MALEDIEVFTEVVDSKSFTKAAKRLGIPTSTASAKVARLEEKLGVSLMIRTTRQVTITTQGQAYYKHCRRALAELAEAERELADGTVEPSGILRLTAPADLAQSVLAPIIEDFLSQYRNVAVDLIVTNRIVDLVAEGVDLAVRVGELSDSSMIARKFLNSSVGLWASQDYLNRYGTPITMKDLQSHKMVKMTMAQQRIKLQNSDKIDVSIDFSGRLSTDDMQSCKTFIENGVGIGLLPSFIGEYAPKASKLVRVMPELESTQASTYFVYPNQRFISQNVRCFIDCAMKRMKMKTKKAS